MFANLIIKIGFINFIQEEKVCQLLLISVYQDPESRDRHTPSGSDLCHDSPGNDVLTVSGPMKPDGSHLIGKIVDGRNETCWGLEKIVQSNVT
jgi:hypothetical protein